MENLQEKLIARLKKGEEALEAYEAFRKDPSVSKADSNAVAFAQLYELFAFSALHELLPEYIPSRTTQIQIAQGLGGARGYVTVENGKVKISPEYYTFLTQAQEMKAKLTADGKLAKTPGPDGK